MWWALRVCSGQSPPSLRSAAAPPWALVTLQWWFRPPLGALVLSIRDMPLPYLHSLQSNTIKDDGARSMAEALAANRTLSVIQ